MVLKNCSKRATIVFMTHKIKILYISFLLFIETYTWNEQLTNGWFSNHLNAMKAYIFSFRMVLFDSITNQTKFDFSKIKSITLIPSEILCSQWASKCLCVCREAMLMRCCWWVVDEKHTCNTFKYSHKPR